MIFLLHFTVPKPTYKFETWTKKKETAVTFQVTKDRWIDSEEHVVQDHKGRIMFFTNMKTYYLNLTGESSNRKQE